MSDYIFGLRDFIFTPGFCRRQERSKTACTCLLIWFLIKLDEILGKIPCHAIPFGVLSVRKVDKRSFTNCLSKTHSPWQNPRSCHTQRCDNVSHWNINVKGKFKYRQRQKIICLNHFSQVYSRKFTVWLLGPMGSNSNMLLDPMNSSERGKAPQTAWMSLQSPHQYTCGETFIVLFSVCLWTHSYLLKSVRNYHNSLSKSVIIFAKRFVAHEGFLSSPGFREGGKGKRLLLYHC